MDEKEYTDDEIQEALKKERLGISSISSDIKLENNIKIPEKKIGEVNLRDINTFKFNSVKDARKVAQNQEGEDVGFLDKLDEKLYSRGRNNYDETRSRLTKPTKKPDFSWNSDIKKNGSIQYEIQYESIKKNFSFLALGAFIFSFILMLGAFAYAFWSINFAGNTIRQDKIELDLTIANFTEADKSLAGEIKVANKNRTSFSDSYLSLDLLDSGSGLTRNITQIDLGEVKSGELVNKNINLNLVGKEGAEENLTLTLFYKVPKSDSVFQKSLSQKILITKSPVSIAMFGPKSLSVEQEGEYSIKVRGVSESIQHIYLELNPPKQMFVLSPNFTEISKNIYDLGQLKQGEEKEFKFKGVFKEVQEFTERFTLKAKVGDYADGTLVNSYAENSYSLTLENLPISILVSSDSQSGNKIYFTSKEPKVKIQVKNDSGSKLKNGDLQIRLLGGLFNQKSVSVKGAEYNSATGVIYANGETTDNMKDIDIDETFEVEAEFKNLSSTSFISNKNITLEILFKAENTNNTGLPSIKKFVSVLTPKQIVKLDAMAMYFSGPLKNSGPIPPQVATATTYTVLINVETEGGFTDGKYTAKIPASVRFVKTLDDKVKYNKNTREVVWTVGVIEKPTNNLVQLNKKETAFQVEIIPLPDHVKKSPNLVDSLKFEGIDGTGQEFVSAFGAVTTNLSKDPKYEISKSWDIVTE
jgi:hypothetical protein